MKKQSQQGMTTVGWIIVIAIFGSIVLTAFKIIPLYLEYMNVQSIMSGVAQDDTIDPRSKRDLWRGLEKRLYVNQVRSIERKDVSFSRSKEGVTTVTVDYKVEKPWIAQLYIGAHFTHSVEINR